MMATKHITVPRPKNESINVSVIYFFQILKLAFHGPIMVAIGGSLTPLFNDVTANQRKVLLHEKKCCAISLWLMKRWNPICRTI